MVGKSNSGKVCDVTIQLKGIIKQKRNKLENCADMVTLFIWSLVCKLTRVLGGGLDLTRFFLLNV